MTTLIIILFVIAMGLMAYLSYYSYRYKSTGKLQTLGDDYLKKRTAIIAIIAAPFLVGAMIAIALQKPIFPNSSHLESILLFISAGSLMIGAYISQIGTLYVINQKEKQNPKFIDPEYAASFEKRIKYISYPFLYIGLILSAVAMWVY